MVASPKAAVLALAACWSTAVLLDLSTGWDGHCLQLEHKPSIATMEECHDTAFQDPTVPVWQYNNHSGCWQGAGRNCNTDLLPATIVGSQRLQHGAVRVLKDMTSWHVHGLLQLGIFNHGTEAEDIERCRSWCYSNVFCEYWQYGQGGCWVDDGGASGSRVPHPLIVGSGVDNSSIWARTSVAGEYIQHYCPSHSTATPAVAPLAPPEPPLSPWQVALLGLAVLAALAALVYVCTLCARDAGKTRSRGTKPGRGRRARDEEPPRSPRSPRDLERRGEDEPMIRGPPQVPQLAPPVLAQRSSPPQGCPQYALAPGAYQPTAQQFVPPVLTVQAAIPPQYRGAVP